MRALFYTATAFFIVLGGVFAFYALQGSAHQGGAKVVLSIDTSEAPAETAAAADEPERDLYAEVADKLRRLEGEDAQHQPAAEEANGENAQSGIESDRLPVDGDRLPADAEESQAQPLRAEEPASEAAEPAGEATAEAESEDLPLLPPGTALAGLEDDRPIFRNIEQQRPAAEETSPPSPDSTVTTTAAETPLRGTQLSPEPEERLALAAPAPDEAEAAPGSADAPLQEQPAETADAPSPDADSEPDASAEDAGPARSEAAASDATSDPDEQAKLNAFLAALNEREAQSDRTQPSGTDEQASLAAPSSPPPPLPAKRPNSRTAALGGWGSTKITATDKAALKPARVAILLRGVGRNDQNSSDAVTKLPPAVSLGFTPFAGGAQQWARKASELGHEVIVQLPLEPSDYPINNPGPETLLSSSAAEENISRLGTILSRFDGYSGVTNYLGGKLLQSKTALRPILENVKSRGLIYVGEGNNSHAVVRGLAGEIGLRYGNANVMIDAQPAPAAIQKALQRLVEIARKEGSAIGLGYASRATIEQLAAWTQTLAAEGVTLVPVGALAQTPGAS